MSQILGARQHQTGGKRADDGRQLKFMRNIRQTHAEQECADRQHAARTELLGYPEQVRRHRNPYQNSAHQKGDGENGRFTYLPVRDHTRCCQTADNRQYDQPQHIVNHCGTEDYLRCVSAQLTKIRERPCGDPDAGRGQSCADEHRNGRR